MADIGARKAMRRETNFETGPPPNDDGVVSDCFSIWNGGVGWAGGSDGRDQMVSAREGRERGQWNLQLNGDADERRVPLN